MRLYQTIPKVSMTSFIKLTIYVSHHQEHLDDFIINIENFNFKCIQMKINLFINNFWNSNTPSKELG